MCIETGEIFDSLSEAERKHNITRSSIVKVCKGSMYTAGGKHWKFVDEVAEDDADRETHHLNEEHKALLSSKATTKKPVICVETGKIYESVKEASRVTEIRENNIRRACKETNRTAGGYHWLFVNEPQS